MLDSQQFILGKEVAAIGEEMARFYEARYAIAVASGTDALLLSLRAAGAGPGDEVIVPAFSFIATAGAVTTLGARPIFADVRPDTFNLAPAELPRRDHVQAFLTQRNIGATVYYPVPLPFQPLYASFGHKPGDFLVAERTAQEVLSLPMYLELRSAQIRRVAESAAQAVSQ